MTDHIQPATFRRKGNLWLARGSEAVRPLLRSYARHLAPAPTTAPKEWKTGLLMGASHIGDVLYRTASLAALRRGLPGCSWYYVTSTPADQVLLHNPHLAGLIVPPAGPVNIPQFKEQIIATVGRLPDAALCYDAGGYLPSVLLAARLGIPNRVAYRHKGFSGLVTHPMAFRYPQAFTAYFRDLVAELTGLAPDWSLRPQMYPSAEDEVPARAWWQANGLGHNEPVVACFCTSRQPTGVLPLEKFIEIFRGIRKETSARMILAGAKGDRSILERVNAEAQLNAPILAGDLGLRSLCCLLRDCRVVVTTDSGPRHLANAAGAPVVFVRNLSFSKAEAGTYLDTEHDMAPDVELVSPAEQAQWMAQVSPAAMIARVSTLLRQPG